MTAAHHRSRFVIIGNQPLRRYASNLGLALSVTGLLALLIYIGASIATTTTPQERLDQRISADFQLASVLLERCQADHSTCPSFYAHFNDTLKPDVIEYRSKMYDSGNTPTDDLVIGDLTGPHALHQLEANDPLIVLAIHGKPQ